MQNSSHLRLACFVGIPGRAETLGGIPPLHGGSAENTSLTWRIMGRSKKGYKYLNWDYKFSYPNYNPSY